MKKRIVVATIFLLISPYLLSTVTYAEETDLTSPPTQSPTTTTDLNNDFSAWQQVSANEVASVNFARGSQNFRGELHFPSTTNALFKNQIYDTTESPEAKHTYVYNNEGSSTTSWYWVIPPTGSPIKIEGTTANNYYAKSDGDGNKMLGRVVTAANFQVSETVQITPSGAVVHNLKFLNRSGTQINDYQFRSFLDTDLDGNDQIPIYANGNNGAYITNGKITLFSEPIKNTVISGGTYSNGNMTNAKPTKGIAYGTQLTTSVDSAISYDTPKVSLAPNQSVELSYKERVFTQDEELGHVKVNYLEDVTNQPVTGQTDISNTLGEEFHLTPKDIPGYHYVRVEGTENGTYQEQTQVVTYYYAKNIVGQPITIHYLDREGNVVHEPQTINDTLGAEYDTSTPTYRLTVPNYTLDQTRLPLNSRGNITDQAQTVTYVYRKNAQPVTVRYFDQNGKAIPGVASQTINGVVDDSYDATTSTYKKEIPGYVLDVGKLPTNGRGTLTNQAQNVDYTYKKIAKGVVVHYVDQDGQPIPTIPSKLITGNVGDSYDATTNEYKLEISGYDLDENKLPEHAIGNLGDDAVAVTYSYQKKTQATVTYLDQAGNKIAGVEDKQISGHVHDPYDATSEQYKIKIPGYDLDESKLPDNAVGNQTDPGQVIPYIYKKIAQNITVKYVDGQGNPIRSEQVIEGHIQDPYDATTEKYKLAIEGYDLDEAKLPTNAIGILGDDGQIVTYTYQKIAKPVTVRYQDQAGNEIHPDQTIAGHVGDPYDATSETYKLSLPDYDLINPEQSPTNAKGILEDEAKTVTYIYQKIAKAATVKYVDEEGNELHEPQVISGHVGDFYDVTSDAYKLSIDDYQLDQAKLPENAKGKLTEQDQMILYVYQKVAKPLTVKYVDQAGNPIEKEKVITGAVNDDYDTKSERLSISGYRLDQTKLPTNETGKLNETEQTVTYVYDKLAKKVTIEYVDQIGMKLHEAKEIEGIIGASYDATTNQYKIAISDYELDQTKLPSNGKGQLGEAEQTVTYVYQKKTTVPSTTGTSTTNTSTTPPSTTGTSTTNTSTTPPSTTGTSTTSTSTTPPSTTGTSTTDTSTTPPSTTGTSTTSPSVTLPTGSKDNPTEPVQTGKQTLPPNNQASPTITVPNFRTLVPSYLVYQIPSVTPNGLIYPATSEMPATTTVPTGSLNSSNVAIPVTQPGVLSTVPNTETATTFPSTASAITNSSTQTRYPQTGERKKFSEVLSLFGLVLIAGVVVVKKRHKKE